MSKKIMNLKYMSYFVLELNLKNNEKYNLD